MSAHGLNPGQFPMDGKVFRFNVDNKDKKKSGWVVGFQNHSNSGETFYVVRGGNFKTGETFQFQSDDKEFDKYDRERIKKQIEEAKRKAEVEREQVQ